MTMGHRETLKTADEFSVFTGWRKFIARYTKAGEAKKVKKRFNRRIRRTANMHIEQDEY